MSTRDSQVAVGEGKLPIPGIFRALQTIKYPGLREPRVRDQRQGSAPGMQVSFAYMRGALAGLAAEQRGDGAGSEGAKDARPRDVHRPPSSTPRHVSRPMIDRRLLLPLALASTVAVATACAHASSTSVMQSSSDPNYVEVVPHEADRRVDVLVGGKPFTSYIWPTTLKKPVLYPLLSANGVVVTRGYPLEPRAGRARRPSASRRPVVQLRRRERSRLLEQLRRDPGRRRRRSTGTIVHRADPLGEERRGRGHARDRPRSG